MICTQCEKEIRDDAQFCSYCGCPTHYTMEKGNEGRTEKPVSAVSNLQKSAVTQRHYHPYQELGGWLGLVTYGMLIGVILTVVSTVYDTFRLWGYWKYLDGTTKLFMVLMMVVAFVTLYWGICMYRMIKSKSVFFLRTYETIILFEAVFFIVLRVAGFATTSTCVRDLLGLASVFFVWSTYFCRSVRVRTYYGTDEYLRKSHFFKNVNGPEPAVPDGR